MLEKTVEFIEVLPTPLWTAVNFAEGTIEFSDKIGETRNTPTIENQLSHVFCLAVTLRISGPAREALISKPTRPSARCVRWLFGFFLIADRTLFVVNWLDSGLQYSYVSVHFTVHITSRCIVQEFDGCRGGR